MAERDSTGEVLRRRQKEATGGCKRDEVEVIRGLFDNAIYAMLTYFRGVMDGYEAQIKERDETIEHLRDRIRANKAEPRD